jgi:hypothetical protein
MNMRTLVVAIFIASVLCAVPYAKAQENKFSMDYWGFTYTDAGELKGLGFIPVIEPPLVVDLVKNQYTWVVKGAMLDSSRVEGGIEYYWYSGGSFEVFEDSNEPWNAVYSDENCQAPDWIGEISDVSTFEDGELYLQGDFLTLEVTFYTDYGFGDFEGMMDLTGGSHLNDIPPAYQTGWTFGGTTDQPWACIPEDFDHRWDGQLFLVMSSSTEKSTWGGIKSTFR